MNQAIKETAGFQFDENPFALLRVSTRDNRQTIVEMADERSLTIDVDLCQKARTVLTNPRVRLTAEVSWTPGVAPRVTEEVLRRLSESDDYADSFSALPPLARANVMSAVCGRKTERESVESIADFIRKFAITDELIRSDDVLRDINEDRRIAGIPEARETDLTEALLQRRRDYRLSLREMLDGLPPNMLVDVMTMAVFRASDYGRQHSPVLLDDLVDTYEVESQIFLEAEASNLRVLIQRVRDGASGGASAIQSMLERLETIVRSWSRVARPIQVSAKSRGTAHEASENVAFDLRSLAVDLNNDFGLTDCAVRLTSCLRESFRELPEFSEKVEEDMRILESLRKSASERERKNAEWEQAISFDADIGLVFKDRLSISSKGVSWKGRSIPLELVTRVRWGGIRRSVNGIPTGTEYKIGISDNFTEHVISLRDEKSYFAFTKALWRAVCGRLILDIVDKLEGGAKLNVGNMIVENEAVTLVEHRFFSSDRTPRLRWHDVDCWSHDGNFIIGSRTDKKVYASASYIDTWNAHLLEHIVCGAFKKRVSKLSDFLAD